MSSLAAQVTNDLNGQIAIVCLNHQVRLLRIEGRRGKGEPNGNVNGAQDLVEFDRCARRSLYSRGVAGYLGTDVQISRLWGEPDEYRHVLVIHSSRLEIGTCITCMMIFYD